VEAELVRDGVSRGEISIHGFGETNPLRCNSFLLLFFKKEALPFVLS
jgi:hypothetical protein